MADVTESGPDFPKGMGASDNAFRIIIGLDIPATPWIPSRRQIRGSEVIQPNCFLNREKHETREKNWWMKTRQLSQHTAGMWPPILSRLSRFSRLKKEIAGPTGLLKL